MRKSTFKKMRAARTERAEHLARTGFARASELEEFNTAWAHLGVLPDEVWPVPKQIDYRFWALENEQGVEKDEADFERLAGQTPERAFRTPGHQAQIQQMFAPVQQLNTSIHEAIHFEIAKSAGFPHSGLYGPKIACKIGPTGFTFSPTCGSVAYEEPFYERFAKEKQHECAVMWFGPLACMPTLMPESTSPEDFQSDFDSVAALGLTEDQDKSAMEAAVSLIVDSDFLARVYYTARRFRPLIQAGGEHFLTNV
jgi:hypothetical protein